LLTLFTRETIAHWGTRMAEADTINEFIKSYHEGWFGLRLNDKQLVPSHITETRQKAEGYVALRYIPKAGSSQELSHDLNWISEKEKLERGYPDLGMIKIGHTVGYMKTRPYRQFKKGYVPANVELFVPNYTEIRKQFPRFVVSSSNREVIWQVFNREWWHPLEAIRLMDEGEGVGYPVSHNFGLYCRADVDNILILRKNRDIGVYTGGRFEIFKGSEMFKEEFTRETKVECFTCDNNR